MIYQNNCVDKRHTHQFICFSLPENSADRWPSECKILECSEDKNIHSLCLMYLDHLKPNTEWEYWSVIHKINMDG